MKHIAIVGLGYVGLPLALQFARSGAKVLGLDIDSKKTDAILGGQSYIKHVTAEAIAEHAGEQIKGGVELEPVGDPVTVGSAGGILLKRSGGKLKDKLVAAYLYRDERGDWGFLAIPIPYKAPRILGKDVRWLGARSPGRHN